jgi:hypothetical protein
MSAATAPLQSDETAARNIRVTAIHSGNEKQEVVSPNCRSRYTLVAFGDLLLSVPQKSSSRTKSSQPTQFEQC